MAYDPTQPVPPPLGPTQPVPPPVEQTRLDESIPPPPPPLIPSELPYFQEQRARRAAQQARRTRITIIVLSILAVIVVATAVWASLAQPPSVPSQAIVAPTDTPFPSPTPFTPTPTIDNTGWQTLVEYIGASSLTTDVFTVPATWRISWSAYPLVRDSMSIDLYAADGKHIATIFKADTSQQGIYSAQAMPGSFYLKIVADGSSYLLDVQVRS